MPGGADWEREIEQRLRACDIFILLVSRHSLSSDYIVDKEIAIIRDRQAKGDAVHFYPLVLTPTPEAGLRLVSDKNLRPRDGKALSSYREYDRWEKMNEVANEIAQLAKDLDAVKNRVAEEVDISPSASRGDDLDQAALGGVEEARIVTWLRDGKNHATAVAIGARAALRVVPLEGFKFEKRSEPGGKSPTSALIGPIFRACAVSLIAPGDRSAAQFASGVAQGAAQLAAPPGRAAAESAAFAARACAYNYADVVAPIRAASSAAAHIGREAGASVWAEVGTDIEKAQGLTRRDFIYSALWSNGLPGWASKAWSFLRSALPSDEDWEVWIDWYEQRLRGGSHGKDYELAFVKVPQAEWDKGPAAANTWIRQHLPQRDEEQRTSGHQIDDEESLRAWLVKQSREIAVAIAGRAALRIAPLVASAGHVDTKLIARLTSAVFRATALARADVQAGYATANTAANAYAANAAADVQAGYAVAAATATAAAYAASAANAAANVDAAYPAAAAAAHAAAAADADADANAAAAVVWQAVRSDAAAALTMGAQDLVDLPLWSDGLPDWANVRWSRLAIDLPRDEDWDVWIEWYENRLRGGSHSEDCELVFASVPQEEWDKGPAAANAWIKAHLPKAPDSTLPTDLPEPMAGLDAPFAYGWTATRRVAVVAGAQNLPFYPHFSSEEDHRRALDACRVGGERLLKTLRDGHYNARREYGEALEYYLEDLPKTAGVGNILLANDQVRILHDMFLADAGVLSEGFASRLKSVIANQFALNAFYDLVQRHNEAVSAGNWTRPFPLEATKGFFGAVEDNTPRWFEPQVERGLRQVEQAEPPATVAESTPASGIEPPPLPPGTPDAQESWKRQMATAANALWDTFLQGQDMPVDKDEWRATAEDLGAHIRPILNFLRAQGQRKE
jgi:hypothetical protein